MAAISRMGVTPLKYLSNAFSCLGFWTGRELHSFLYVLHGESLRLLQNQRNNYVARNTIFMPAAERQSHHSFL